MRLRLSWSLLLVLGCAPNPSDAEGGGDDGGGSSETGTGSGSGGSTDTGTETSTDTGTDTDETDTDSGTDTETDSGTDSDTDTGMDTDTDTGGASCADMVDLASELGMANMVVQPDYIWDQGWAMSACVSGDEVVGEAYIFIRPVDADASSTYCAQAYDLTGTPADGCDVCDMAFSPNLVDGTSIDYQDFAYCDQLANLAVPTWGIDLDGDAGNPLMMHQVDMMTWEPLSGPDASLTVTPVEDEEHIDWLWNEEYNAD